MNESETFISVITADGIVIDFDFLSETQLSEMSEDDVADLLLVCRRCGGELTVVARQANSQTLDVVVRHAANVTCKWFDLRRWSELSPGIPNCYADLDYLVLSGSTGALKSEIILLREELHDVEAINAVQDFEQLVKVYLAATESQRKGRFVHPRSGVDHLGALFFDANKYNASNKLPTGVRRGFFGYLSPVDIRGNPAFQFKAFSGYEAPVVCRVPVHTSDRDAAARMNELLNQACRPDMIAFVLGVASDYDRQFEIDIASHRHICSIREPTHRT